MEIFARFLAQQVTTVTQHSAQFLIGQVQTNANAHANNFHMKLKGIGTRPYTKSCEGIWKTKGKTCCAQYLSGVFTGTAVDAIGRRRQGLNDDNEPLIAGGAPLIPDVIACIGASSYLDGVVSTVNRRVEMKKRHGPYLGGSWIRDHGGEL